MAQNDEGFAARWSRLKRAAKEQPEDEAPPTEEEAPEASAEAAEQAEPEVPELPPIEELDKDSDFSVFMREGVPEEMRRLALRKLWTTDPVLANLDGLLEYGEDFSLPFKNPGVVATLYRVGQGMPDAIKELVEKVVEGESDESQEPAATETLAKTEADEVEQAAADPEPADSPKPREAS